MTTIQHDPYCALEELPSGDSGPCDCGASQTALPDPTQIGHFIHMNKLLDRSRKSCAKFANGFQRAEKDLRETKVDRDKWKARALVAEAQLASLGISQTIVGE
jgi:hypothetical protein